MFMLFVLPGLCCIFPSTLNAGVFIQTKIVSGQVVSITESNTIEMDDGFLYYPAKKNMRISVRQGEYISIRYYVDGNDQGKRKYIKYAPGKNSLKQTYAPKRKMKSKNMF